MRLFVFLYLDLMTSVQQLIAYLSTVNTLEEGDLILTGTPSGVSEVLPGDVIRASLSNGNSVLSSITFPITQEE